MIKITVDLHIERFHEPQDQNEFRNFLWTNDIDLSGGDSDSTTKMKLGQFIKLLQMVKFQDDDHVEVSFETRPF
jgi:hypothetical protein